MEGQPRGLRLSPARLVFAAGEPGRAQRQSFRVLNAAPFSQRLHLLPPGAGAFRLECAKTGSLAAGMSQTATVVFAPAHNGPQRSAVEVVGQGGGLYLALEAQGGEGAESFPTRAVLPFRGIGLPCRLAVELRNTSRHAMPFAFRLAEGRPEVCVRPTGGELAAGEETTVEFEWTPRAGELGPVQGQLTHSHPSPTAHGFELRLATAAKKIRKASTASIVRGETVLPAVPEASAPSPPERQLSPLPRTRPARAAPSLEAQQPLSPRAAFDAEYRRVAQLGKERTLSAAETASESVFSATETAETLSQCEAEPSASKLVELLCADAELSPSPELFPEDALLAPKATDAGALMAAKVRCRERLMGAVLKVIVRNRLERVLAALRASLEIAARTAAAYRPFLPRLPLAAALALPEAAPVPNWRLPSLPLVGLPLPQRKAVPRLPPPPAELLASNERTRLPPVEVCFAESYGYAPVDLFRDYVFVPRLAEAQPAKGELDEDVLFDEAGEEPSALDAQRWALPQLRPQDVLADFRCQSQLFRPQRECVVFVEATEASVEFALARAPTTRPDALQARRGFDEAFVGRFTARASGYSAFWSCFALETEQSPHALHPQPRPYDVLLLQRVDEHCPRRITRVLKDDRPQHLSSDSEDEPGAAGPGVFRVARARPAAWLPLPNLIAAQEARVAEALRRCKLLRAGRAQTLKADVNAYVLHGEDRLSL